MSKLTKAQAKAHAQATALLQKDILTDDEREFVRSRALPVDPSPRAEEVK